MSNPIELMHGNDWQGQDVSGWIASEKFDGHRVRWTGNQLLTRSGELLNCPASFTSHLPDFALDCELWAGRGNKHNDVRRFICADQWENLALVPFDVPGMNESDARIALKHVRGSAQFSIVDSIKSAKDLMRAIVALGGEGIMLRKPGSPYLNFRNDNLLKLKGAKES